MIGIAAAIGVVATGRDRTLRVGFAKSSKNDAVGAEAIFEAAMRPTMRFVPVKSRRNSKTCNRSIAPATG